MTELKRDISDQIKKIVPAFDKLEVRVNIGDNGYSGEFFVTQNGVRMQCFEMVDSGLFKEKEVDAVFEEIAKCVRESSTYVSGEINKIAFTVEE